MKNRLQFNRHFPIFSGTTEVVGGEEVWISGREQAKEWLETRIKRTDFIPLIGEPIVLRYLDNEGKKQLILAVGKATGNTTADTTHREYHIIDSAELNEGVNAANENAAEALQLASAASKTVADYRVILQNMIGDGGVELEDGSYFETDDPTGCGLYKVYPGTNFISAATSLAKADYILDQAIGKANDNLAELSGATADAIDGLNGLSAATQDLSANTVAGLAAVNDRVSELSAVTAEFSAATDNLLDEMKEGAGLEADGTYEHPHEKYPGQTNYINEASSLYDADMKLDAAITELSANTTAADQALDGKINDLSANTVAAINELSGNSESAIRELSANTVAADQVLQGQIDELANRKILGQDAVKVNTVNGDSTVSLLISDQDKALSQDVYGLKANLNLVYSSADTKIYLMGKDNQEIAHIDTNDFIKDGMIDEVKIITPTQAWIDEHPEYAYANLEAGKPYLWITFNMDSEKSPKDVFLRLDSLVDTYTVDPDSRNFMEINDYVISLKVNEDGGLAGYDYAKGISAVTTNIISATGLNIGAQGTYPGHDDTNYIKYAGSLDQADVLLDAAIYGVSGMVIDLSGNVINYIDEKTEGYDEKIDDLEDKVNELSAVTQDFSAATYSQIMELSARTFDPQEIYDYVDAADERLQEGIDEEASARTAEDAHLQEQIDALSGRVNDNADNLAELSGATEQSISDLWDAIGSTSGATNGILTLLLNDEEQGQYSPSANTEINLEVTGENVFLTGYEIASGHGEEELTIVETDSINEAFGKVQKQILDNELVIAAAFNDINDRLSNVSGAVSDLSDEISDLNDKVITGVSIDGVPQPVVDNVVNLEIDVPVVANFFDGAEYDSVDKEIRFYHGQTVVDSIDATAFIKDGMLDNVTVFTSGGVTYLSFVFNTDSGKETINIDVSEFAGLYTAGSGISISNENVISLLLANKGDTQFLKMDGDGLFLTGVSEAFEALSGIIEDNELVVSAALNDLNDRINELSGATGGDASKLDHNVTLKMAGESYGSAATDFSGAEVNINTYKKFTTAANTANLTLSEFLTVISLGTDSTVTFASAGLPVLPAGGLKEAHVIIENTSSSNIAITVASDARVKCTGGNVFNIPGNDIGELNALITYNGSSYTIYVITT